MTTPRWERSLGGPDRRPGNEADDASRIQLMERSSRLVRGPRSGDDSAPCTRNAANLYTEIISRPQTGSLVPDVDFGRIGRNFSFSQRRRRATATVNISRQTRRRTSG
jgi:hypothetical protein